MIKYSLVLSDNTLYELNGTLIPYVMRNSLSRGAESITFEQKLVSRTFLPGTAKIGSIRLESRQFVFNQSWAFETDGAFDTYVNTLISKFVDAVKIRDTTNGKEAKIAFLDISIPYDQGSEKRSGDISIKIELTDSFWTSVTPISTGTVALDAGINEIVVDNSGYMLAYPKLTFNFPALCGQLDVYVDETKEGLQLIDPTLGSATLNDLIIDCAEGSLTIAGFDRTQNISDRTGYFPLQIGENTIIVDAESSGSVIIEFYERFFV